nr:uncharacterized protein LOC104088303 [Nicotiana tomentosiformis]
MKEFFTQSINKVLDEIRKSSSCQSEKADVAISPMYIFIGPSNNDRHHHSRYDNAYFPDDKEEEVGYATVNGNIKQLDADVNVAQVNEPSGNIVSTIQYAPPLKSAGNVENTDVGHSVVDMDNSGFDAQVKKTITL